MSSIQGIDIASYQNLPDFAAVAAGGYSFVLDKATEGVDYLNPRLPQTWPAIKAASLLRGVYHFADPDANRPEDEAAWFLSQAQPVLEAGDVIALDIEQGSGDLSDWVLRWLGAVAVATGCNPWLYTNRDYLQNRGLAVPAIADTYGLWLADWGLAAMPPAPAPFPFIACWQSGTATVPGIAGPCDVDTFNGDAAAWLRYGVPALAPPPDPCAERIADLEAQVLVLTQTLTGINAEAARLTAGLSQIQGIAAALLS